MPRSSSSTMQTWTTLSTARWRVRKGQRVDDHGMAVQQERESVAAAACP